MLHNHLFDLGKTVGILNQQFCQNLIDRIEKFLVALGYADCILLLHRSILCIGLTCIVQGEALERAILGSDELSRKLVDDHYVYKIANAVCCLLKPS